MNCDLVVLTRIKILVLFIAVVIQYLFIYKDMEGTASFYPIVNHIFLNYHGVSKLPLGVTI